MATSSAPCVWTIGYEGRDIESFVGALVEAAVELLVDVRELPLSRKRGFSKTALGLALSEAGIEYRHLKPLGNPKSNRDGFRAGEASARKRFITHMNNGSRPAFDELAVLTGDRRTALMCFEREHVECHRSCVSDQLADEFGMAVVCL